MTPLRAEEITLYCEDKGEGRSQRILEAAVSALSGELPFAPTVRPGVDSKSDVQVRTKFARTQSGPRLRVFGVRDRDFLTQPLVLNARRHAFHDKPQSVTSWPLSRHCIESYLLDDDMLTAAVPDASLDALHAALDAAAGARLWLDVARGTLEDLAYRLRRIRQQDIEERLADRAAALRVTLGVAEQMRRELDGASSEERLASHLDALASDMTANGPLRCRVDGRELIYELEVALGKKRGLLLDRLTQHARRAPPAALVADVRAILEAMPTTWRTDA